MGDLEYFGWGIASAFALVFLGAFMRGSGKRKSNIHVPRETLWGRTNRYHGVRRG